jgi:hypothetical protein
MSLATSNFIPNAVKRKEKEEKNERKKRKEETKKEEERCIPTAGRRKEKCRPI